MFKNLKITCNEATAICNRNQYGDATLFEKIKLNIHFLRCKLCMLYTKQNMTLSKIYRGHSKKCKEIKHCLTAAQKEDLKKILNE